MSKAVVVCSVAAAGVLLSLSEVPELEEFSQQATSHNDASQQPMPATTAVEATQYAKAFKERPMLLGKCVDPNHASKSALMDLPRIGPKLADRIIRYRSHRHGFKRLRDLKRVKGIGKATLGKIKPYVCIKK